MSYDPFATSTGLIDQYSGTVVESWFGINPRYSETAHLLFWKIKLDDPAAFPQIEDGEIQEQFSLGPKWESLDGGNTVEFPGNDKKNFNANSQYGTIINRAVGEWALRDILSARGVPTEAKIWTGLRFEFMSQILTKPFKDQNTGEMVEPKPKVMPVAYLGDSPEDIFVPDFDISSLGLTNEQETELRQAAESSDSYGQFLDRAMKLQWVAGDGKMVGALADQSLWQAIKLI